MNRKRSISRKQKRARYRDRQKAIHAAKHLTLGDQHDIDRAAAEAMRLYPSVPRTKQPAFPREREMGFAGHFVEGTFIKQADVDFVAMNVMYKEDAWYWRHDKRKNRKPRKQDTGVLESNVPFSTGLARVLASMVEAGDVRLSQELAMVACEAGMREFERLTGYRRAYMALHPDSIGTLSCHYGLWPISREERCLIGRSAGGKRGKRGLRMLGHAFMSLLRHGDAIQLPEELLRLARKNLKERSPDDWAVSVVMDKTLRQELAALPNGKQLLEQADHFQKCAARDWLERYQAGAAGMAALKSERDRAATMAARRKKAAERLLRYKTRHLQNENAKLQELSSSAHSETRLLSEKLEESNKTTQMFSDQDRALERILTPTKDESLVTAAKRVLTERDEAIRGLAELQHAVGIFLIRILDQGIDCIRELIRRGLSEPLSNLSRAVGGNLGAVLHSISKASPVSNRKETMKTSGEDVSMPEL